MQRVEERVNSGSARLHGRYVNCSQIGFSSAEFVIDFGQSDEGAFVDAYHTRIVASPLFIKQLLQTLSKSMRKYERLHGCIDMPCAE